MSDQNPQYTVLARRCRPKSFDEVVGQEHVGQAIQNAIRSGRVAHAYLFTGARGVGKTSTARIFAKALNCPNVKDGIPCNQCEVCAGIGEGNDVDVLEIDGASNRGIDDIRQLRANVSIRSMRSPNKVYIIDEVHMLTKEAFNALLKTLEEPPPNVKFVFCTTEPNKVPDTILSRCQRFDFGTIAQSSIAGRLTQIALAEGKVVDADAVELVARRAAGSMRDSQSLFDQLLAFGGERITADDVHRLLGTASDDRIVSLVDSLINNQPAEALAAVEAAMQQGVQIGSFSDQLLAYLRDLMVTAAGAEGVPLSAVSESSRSLVREQAQRWGLQTISAAMQILAETKSRMQRATFARALLELAIVRLASLEQLDRIATLMATGVSSTAGAPAATPPRVQPAAPFQKKSPEFSPRPVTSPPAATPVSAPSPSTPAPATSVQKSPEPASVKEDAVAFGEDSLAEFWNALMAKVPENLGNHLKNASKTAIFGPNHLEILFPRSYSFSKSYCEKSEGFKKLSAVAQELAGRQIDFRVGFDESAPVVKKVSPKEERSRTPERMKTSVVDGDTFVQMAVAIFGGKVEEVRPLAETVVAVESEMPVESEMES
ncbi:DNA polymerase III subunit gamma/tau [Planctomicrobium sp. SH661]|uniref:DNA polymerase III subunit gamma/tau n=1 Tax=Planctomicrobium sp. SH661 TaxID=3448124 RepID=UPI003F5C6A81